MDLFQFFARFHVLVLHLPIGILMLSALMEVAHLFRAKTGTARPSLLNWVWVWGGVSAAVACVLGWMLSQADGYNPDAVFIHRTFGISVVLVAFVCWLYFKKSGSKTLIGGKQKVIGSAFASLQLFVLFATGHYGANMTHGETYLVEYAPNTIRAIAGLPPHEDARPPITSLANAHIYKDVVDPMLQKTCSSCHNDSKQKGGLNLAKVDALFAGGKSGNTIVAGNSQASELYKRIMLDHDDEEFMPAEGKKPLTDTQVAVLKWWIDAGAPIDGNASEFAATKEAKEHLNDLLGLSEVLFAAIDALSPEQKQALHKAGFVVKRLAQDNNYLDLDLSISKMQLSQNSIALLNEVAANIAYLNLSKTDVSNALLESLPIFENLQRLRLDNTAVSTGELSKLSELSKLRFLNLYGTDVDDNIFAILASLSSLEQVFLSETQVSQAAVEEFIASSQVKVFWSQPHGASDDTNAQASKSSTVIALASHSLDKGNP